MSPNICSLTLSSYANLTSGLALWNRNGYYCTLVTPDGEVIDPMGIVTGGSGTSLEGKLAHPTAADSRTGQHPRQPGSAAP